MTYVRGRSRPTKRARPPDFLIAHGGPFYELQRRLGLLHEHALNAGRRRADRRGPGLGRAAAAGGPRRPCLERVRRPTRPYLLDLGAWARFFVAVGVLVLSERQVEQRLRTIQAPVPARAAAGAGVAGRPRRRRWCERCGGAIPRGRELVILVAGGAARGRGARAEARRRPVALAGAGGRGRRAAPHAAGWWCLARERAPVLVPAPALAVAASGLGAAAARRGRLQLRLVATHPDGYGGLAFIGEYPNAFAAFVFAMTCVVAAEALQAMLHGKLAASAFPYAMGVWLIVVVLLFAFPLAAFAAPLKQLKQRTLLAMSAAATRHERARRAGAARHQHRRPGAEPRSRRPAAIRPRPTPQVRKLGTLPVTKAAPAAAGDRRRPAAARRRGDPAAVQGAAQGGEDAAAVTGTRDEHAQIALRAAGSPSPW